MTRTFAVLSFFVAALLVGLLLNYLVATSESRPTKEHFAQKSVGMPLDMESTPSGMDSMFPLLGSEPRATPLVPYDMTGDEKLFQFDSNNISAECCPSPFTTDRGCVCLTDEQIKVFESRGGNRA